ncbi:hypothetical protein MTO96_007144 [Rhipicephalus appendiculatus]
MGALAQNKRSRGNLGDTCADAIAYPSLVLTPRKEMATDLKEFVHSVVEANSQDLWELSRFVWEHPELAFKEVQCHDWITDFLERRGFTVTRRYLLDTAFRAEFDAPGWYRR